MIRILLAEPLGFSREAKAKLQRLGQVDEGPLSRAELIRCLPEYDVLIVRLAHQIDSQVLAAATKLKAIVTATTGLDHIDTDYAGSRGIAVLSLKGETAFLEKVNATAEHTWALLLALLRRIPQAFESVRAGHWQRDAFRGRELAGKRLGVLGVGRLGRKVAQYGRAFEMEVWGYDINRGAGIPELKWADSLPELLQHSDVLSIHVPLTRATRGLIGRAELAVLPRGAVLVNTSRGEVIEEKALLEALQSGRLAGAALDVLSNERGWHDLSGHPLVAYAREHDNLLLTPHIGGATVESMARTEVFMVDKLAQFLVRARTGRDTAGRATVL